MIEQKFVVQERNPETKTHFVSHKRTIGSKIERLVNKAYWKRLSNLNQDYEWYKIIKNRIVKETKKQLELLRLDNKLYYVIIKNAYKYYNQLTKGTKSRNEELITAVTIYLYCIQNFIIVRKKELIENIYHKKIDFDRTLLKILKNNPEIQKKLRSDQFRIQIINKMLWGISAHFNFDFKFNNKIIPFLEKLFPILKTRPNNAIALIITGIIKTMNGDIKKFICKNGKKKECLHLFKISKFLGVQLSCWNNNKELREHCISHFKKMEGEE